MRRRVLGLTLAALLCVTLTIPAFASSRDYADDFSSGGYSGSTGSTAWATPWSDHNDTGGASSGSVTVSNSSTCHTNPCLVIAPLLLGVQVGAQRRVDMTNSSGATLQYEVNFPGGFLISGSLVVEARADGGAWTTLKTHGKGTDGGFEVNLPAATEYVDIRFRTGLSLAVGNTAGFDDIEVDVDLLETTTTTTTTSSTTTTTSAPAGTSSTTTTTRPIITIPTTITLPPILTTTTLPPISTTSTTTSSTTSSTSTTVGERDDPERTTTTTTARDVTTSTTTRQDTTTTSTTVPSIPPDDPIAGPTEPPPPPSQTFGVITGLDPGLTLSQGLDLTAQDQLLVRFIRASENISFDILMNLALGILLAWASLSTMQRRAK